MYVNNDYQRAGWLRQPEGCCPLEVSATRKTPQICSFLETTTNKVALAAHQCLHPQ